MNTKKKSSNILLTILLLSTLLFQQCNNAEKEHQSHQAHDTMPEEIDMAQLINSPNKTVLSRQATVKLVAQNETQTLKAQGYIDFDRNSSQTVSARFGGRIENLYVKYDFQYVKKGDKILELYSPELNTFQEEHLFLLKSAAEKTLLEQSREKLKLLGITDFQISQLEKNKTFTQAISIYSPIDGYILLNAETKNSNGADATQQTAMNNMNMDAPKNSGKKFGSSNSQIRVGMYINSGETLFDVNDLKNVWAIVSVSSEFNSDIQNNMQVKITSELLPNKPLSGKILLTEQTFEDNNQRFSRIRIDLPNTKGELKINSLVTAEIPLGAKGSFQIPLSAVYRTGLNSFVWVKTGITQNGSGIFQLRKVAIGSAVGSKITIVRGLSANEEVALHAGSLTDSETFLNEN